MYRFFKISNHVPTENPHTTPPHGTAAPTHLLLIHGIISFCFLRLLNVTCHLNAAQIPTARRNRHSSNRAEEPILLALLCGRPQLMKHTQALLDFSLLRNTTPHNRSLLPGGSACVYQNDHSSSQTGGRYVLCIPCIFYTRCCSSVPSSRRVHNYRQGARAHQPGGECGCCSVRFPSYLPQHKLI